MVVGTRVAIFSPLFGLFSSLIGANTQSIRQGWQGCVCERERAGQGTPGDGFVSNEEMVVVVVVVLLQGKGDRAAAIIRYTHPATTRALFCSSLKFTVEHFCLCVPHASMIYCCSPSSGGEMCWRRSRVAQNNMLPSTRLRLYHAQMPGVTVPPLPFRFFAPRGSLPRVLPTGKETRSSFRSSVAAKVPNTWSD